MDAQIYDTECWIPEEKIKFNIWTWQNLLIVAIKYKL